MRTLRLFLLGLVVPAIATFSGCGGGGGSSSTEQTGIALPTEISAVAPKAEAAERPAASPRQVLADLEKAMARASLVADLPAGSDYNEAVVKKFVEIKALDVFGIIDTIFNAIRQTHYADAGNVGTGPYKSMVAWLEEGDGGSNITQIQTWTMESTMDSDVNTLHCWIEESKDGDTRVIRVIMTVEQAPTRNDDDTLADLGVWSLKAIFGDTDDYFMADAAIVDGMSRLRVHERQTENVQGNDITSETRGVIFRNAVEGYGKVEYPDYESCWNGGDCSESVPIVTVAFSYNSNYLTLQVGSDDPQSFDRNDEHMIVHKYGVYSATDGTDVQKTKKFGFPVQFVSGGGYGWYGSWQDHHQLYAEGGQAQPADGTLVVRQDVPPGQTPPTYETKSFSGSLTKIELVAGSLDQILGIPAEVFLFDNFQLRWTGTLWELVKDGCAQGDCDDFTDRLPSLEYTGAGDQRSIFLNVCSPGCTNYIYQTTGTPGFYEAHQGPSGQWVKNNPEVAYAPSPGDPLWGSIGGRAYISYTGDFTGAHTGWVQKKVTDFDTRTWTPTFDPAGDTDFYFDLGREYCISNRGANLRVTRTDAANAASSFKVFVEKQTVAKPGALESVYSTDPSPAVLVQQWDPSHNSTYVLDTDPENASYMMLVYHDVRGQDLTDGKQQGDVVETSIWGLRVEGHETDPLQAGSVLYSWQYQAEGNSCAGVTYLIDADSGDYVFLDEPLHFNSIPLPRTDDLVHGRTSDQWLSFALTFDGNTQGLPDTWYELEKVRFTGDDIPHILANNVVVPDGTEVTDGTASYYMKALEVGIFLGAVTSFPLGSAPDMTVTDSIDLTGDFMPFTPHDLALAPPDSDLRYIEGNPVE